MAKAFLARGTCRIAATPHVNDRWGVRLDELRESFRALQTALSQEASGLEVEFGAEIALVTAVELPDAELASFTLGGGDWLMIESPSYGTRASVHAMIYSIQSRGFHVLLAHPERSQIFQEEIEFLSSLVAGGVRTQLTASAVSGRFGRSAQETARIMLDRNLAHVVASDAHDATRRPPGIADQLRGSGHSDMIRWLCQDMPTWILDGGEEPSRPANIRGSGDGAQGILGRLGLRR